MEGEASGHPTAGHEGGRRVQERDQRPSGVTVLAVLSFLGAAAMALVAVAAFVAGGMIADLLGSEGVPGMLVGAGAAILGVGALLLAALNAVIGWGLWTGQGWAWILTVAFEGFWALVSLLGLLDRDLGSLVPLAIAGAILWYLFRPWVRRYFGHAA